MLPGWANTQTTKVNGTPTLSMSILMTFTFSETHYPVQFTVAMTVAKAVIIECDRNTNWRERIQTLENTCYDQNQGPSECSLDYRKQAGCLFFLLLQTDLNRSLMRWARDFKRTWHELDIRVLGSSSMSRSHKVWSQELEITPKCHNFLWHPQIWLFFFGPIIDVWKVDLKLDNPNKTYRRTQKNSGQSW